MLASSSQADPAGGAEREGNISSSAPKEQDWGDETKRNTAFHGPSAVVGLLTSCEDEPPPVAEQMRPIRVFTITDVASGQVRNFSAVIARADPGQELMRIPFHSRERGPSCTLASFTTTSCSPPRQGLGTTGVQNLRNESDRFDWKEPN